MESDSLRIYQAAKSIKSYLRLEGTVLLYTEKCRVFESEIQIPVELISITEKKRFKGRRLIAGLLIFGLSLILLAVSSVLIKMIDENTILNIILCAFGLNVPFSFLICLICTVMFFIRAKTVVLTVAPNNNTIEFWNVKKNAAQIRDLLEQITHAQSLVESPMEHPAQISSYANRFSPILRALLVVFLFLLPALMTEKVFLFWLVLLPIGYHVYKTIQYFTQPVFHRKATQCYLKRQWKDAASLFQTIVNESPDNLPALTRLIEIHLRTGQFDNAIETAAALPEEFIDLKRDIENDTWYFRRLHERRCGQNKRLLRG